MKAAANKVYGSPDVIQFIEVDKPTPNEHQVLVKIVATTVNRNDCEFRKSEYLIIRLINGLFKPRKTILGTEFAGVIEEVGTSVSTFSIGDKVFGLSTFKFGTHAEYLIMDEKSSITHMPSNLSFIEAAGVPEGLMLGINLIRSIKFKQGIKILINGATGSIGSACVQLAKYYGAEITAVCREPHIELVKSLGANTCMDYTKVDFTTINDTFDVVIDAVGKSTFFKCKKILKPDGLYLSTELGYLSQNIFLALWTPFFSKKKVKFPIPTDSKNDMNFFKELLELGHYKPVIDRTYPFSEIVAASHYVESAQKVGNVVITME